MLPWVCVVWWVWAVCFDLISVDSDSRPPSHEVWSRSLFKVFLKLDGVSAFSVDLSLLLMIVGLVSVEQLSFWGV